MFQVDDYVFYGSCGICRVEKICTQPFDGAPSDVLYYVLQTVSEPKQTIWNPVKNEKSYMRYVMTPNDCEEFFALLPTLPALAGENAKQLREAYIGAIKSGIPNEWGRILCTYRSRSRLAEAKLVRVTDAERNFFDTARRLLANEIAMALSLSPAEAEGRILAVLA